MKAHLTFNLPEEQEEFKDAVEGTKYKVKLEDIWNELFRPYYKHGYADAEIQTIVESKNGSKLMEYLIKKYNEVVNED